MNCKYTKFYLTSAHKLAWPHVLFCINSLNFRKQTKFFKDASTGEAHKYESYVQLLCNRNDVRNSLKSNAGEGPPPLPKKPLHFKRLQYQRILSGAIIPKPDLEHDYIQHLLNDINHKIMLDVMSDEYWILIMCIS